MTLKWLRPWMYRGKHRGTFPYHCPDDVCVRIKFWLHGSHVVMGRGVSHRPGAAAWRRSYEALLRTDPNAPWCLYRE
ncbi:hypothetical protein PEGLEG_64 [Mycobacterium phage PegLeg]|uniref:Uncharacterized protein n=1 Tax=Mycobacterium phage PegLeg TaxID=1325953 RepID=R4TBF7_9CAUD|nr:hypothetical protein PEGLEG_64 [Mycobacterium phage PegLeg]AGM12315.1 hypothetical protein PEGLEG_64 [Mycobacterium phage PegLeg]